jgi:hypothetical protein
MYFLTKHSSQEFQKKEEGDVEVEKKKLFFITMIPPTTIIVILACPRETMIHVPRFLR